MGSVQQHPSIDLPKPEGVADLLRRASLDIPQDQDESLVLRQRLDGLLQMCPCLPSQESTLRRGLETRLAPCQAPELGLTLGRLEAVRSDGGRRLGLVVEAGHRHRASFTCGAGLRAVDEDVEDPGLE